MIKHNEYSLQPDLVKHQFAVKAIESPCTLLIAEQAARKMCDTIGMVFIPEEFTLIITTDYNLRYNYSGRVEGSYDLLMEQPESYLDARDVNCNKQYITTLVSHGGIALRVSLFAYMNITEDDMETLDLLGKVHREVIPARIETSIFCEV